MDPGQVPTMTPIKSDPTVTSDDTVTATLGPLLAEFHHQSHLLDRIPFHKAVFVRQEDYEDAVSHRLLYGNVRGKENAHAYIYLFPAARRDTPPALGIYSCDAKGEVEKQILAEGINTYTTPAAAFEGITNGRRALAVAKYYFMRAGFDLKHPVPISATFKDHLVKACTEFREGRDVVTAPTSPHDTKAEIPEKEQNLLEEALSKDRNVQCATTPPRGNIVRYSERNRREEASIPYREPTKIPSRMERASTASTVRPASRSTGNVANRNVPLRAPTTIPVPVAQMVALQNSHSGPQLPEHQPLEPPPVNKRPTLVRHIVSILYTLFATHTSYIS